MLRKDFLPFTCLGCKPHTDERSGILTAVKCFKFEVRRLREREREACLLVKELKKGKNSGEERHFKSGEERVSF